MPQEPPAIYTIGHAQHTMERFLELLDSQEIETVLDIRSHPFSAYASHFCKKPLELALAAAGKHYVYKGGVLGGRPPTPLLESLRLEPRKPLSSVYAVIADSDPFRDEIQDLLERLRQGERMALLCGEEHPGRCHRRQLVGKALAEHGVVQLHLRADGQVQQDAELAAGNGALRPKSPGGM